MIASTKSPSPVANERRSRYSRSLRQRLLFLLLGNGALLLTIFCLIKKGGSFATVLRQASPNVAPVALAALGLTGIIFCGAIDLSIASLIALAGSVFGILVARGADPWICFLGCGLTAGLGSAWNGWWILRLRIPPIIVTLAGLALHRGLALILADIAIPGFGGSLAVPMEAYHAPGKIYATELLWGTIAVALMWEHFAKRPREWLALGSSEEACRLQGLNPGRILLSAFGVNGLFLALAALMYVTRVQYIEPARMALGFELQVIGAVVLGGTNIFGGEGSFVGTLLGVFFLYFVAEALTYAGVSPYFQEAIAGFLILAVIGLDCALHRRRKEMEELT